MKIIVSLLLFLIILMAGFIGFLYSGREKGKDRALKGMAEGIPLILALPLRGRNAS